MSAPASRVVCRNNNHYPLTQEHFLTPSTRCHTHLFGGLGLNGNQERQYISSLKVAALNCHLVDIGDDTDNWRSRIVVYAGSALTLSR